MPTPFSSYEPSNSMIRVITSLAMFICVCSTAFAAIEFSEDQVAANVASSPAPRGTGTDVGNGAMPPKGVAMIGNTGLSQEAGFSPAAVAMLSSLASRSVSSMGSPSANSAMMGGGGGGANGGNGPANGSPSSNKEVCYYDSLTGSSTDSNGQMVDTTTTALPAANGAAAPAMTGMPEPSSWLVWSTLGVICLAYLRRLSR